eukprot:1315139-Amorphochlora_amoeboformis.AAC.1
MELPANVPSLVRNRTTQDPHGNNDTEPNPDAKQNEGTSENKQHNKNAISDQVKQAHTSQTSSKQNKSLQLSQHRPY